MPETRSADLREALAEASRCELLAAWEGRLHLRDARNSERRTRLALYTTDAKRDQTRAARIGRIRDGVRRPAPNLFLRRPCTPTQGDESLPAWLMECLGDDSERSERHARAAVWLYGCRSNYSHIMNAGRPAQDAFGVRGHVPVVGTADGAELTATLVPVGGGRHRLFLNAAVRDAIGKGAGDLVEIRVRLDRSDRMPETPANLREALAEGGASAGVNRWLRSGRGGPRLSGCRRRRPATGRSGRARTGGR